MTVFLIMVENELMNSKYCDSVWENKEDAKEHLRWLKSELYQYGDEYNVTLESKNLYKHIEKV